MKTLFVLNDPPYGTERSYNGLRLAYALGKIEGQTVRVFLLGDGVGCAKHGQKTPTGYYRALFALPTFYTFVHRWQERLLGMRMPS
jgi:uncharacterized protein involved in oxidation of intracellular sulfur